MVQFIKKGESFMKFSSLFILLFTIQLHVFAQVINPDNTAEASKRLQAEQASLRQQFKEKSGSLPISHRKNVEPGII